MKIIEVDEELYQYIASQTQSIGESASDILRRLLHFSSKSAVKIEENISESQATSEFTSNMMGAAEVKEPSVSVSFASKATNLPRKNEELDKQEHSEPVVKPTKKQSDEAIQKIVERVKALLDSESFQAETKAVVRFLSILTVLYRTNPESFAQATESLQGRTRVYFARDEATLLIAGNHTKPKQIPDTPYWVITNTNSGRKMLMLEGAMQSMHLPEELINQVRSFFVAN